MRPYDIIRKKRDGHSLTEAEINWLIEGYVAGEIKDYHMVAWAMAVFFRGMERQEVAWLTQAMVNSGDTLDLSAIEGIKVDKHSTGGVGDTTTLILAPLVAAAGVPVAKMSGRGLGHTGGTLDKLESFQGFNVSLRPEEFVDNVNRQKIALAGQTGTIAPADGLLYALRDVTATVDSIPLIASSVMSKKIASGADALVLDVKTGNGAFMAQPQDAFALARTMVDIGEVLGRRTVAVVTAMDRPLGRAVGNALEVKEAIGILRGEIRGELWDLCLELGSRMLVLGGRTQSLTRARMLLEEKLRSGEALNKLKELVTAQGGDAKAVDDLSLLPYAAYQEELKAETEGWLQETYALGIGAAALTLGAGRASKGDKIDLAVGLEIPVRPGERIAKGQTLAILHANDRQRMEEARDQLGTCFVVGQERVMPLPLICGVVDRDSQISHL
jgi:pyrimidine-nucleoside phosphorylase